MGLVRFITKAFAVLLVAFLVVPLFINENYRFERSVVIEQQPSTIYPLVTHFENWVRWSPWAEIEPTAKFTYAGTTGEVGASMEWKGVKIGSGSMTNLNLEPDRSARSRIVFNEPHQSEGFSVWYFDPAGPNKTKATWAYETKLKYPAERLFSLFLDRILGPDYERGLQNLKNVAEKGRAH